MSYCKYCGYKLEEVSEGIFVDYTEGDVCSGDDNLVNENQPHKPEE